MTTPNGSVRGERDRQLEERFPDIRSKILHTMFITPKDIEDVTGLTEGNIFQGELSLEQLFFNRPVPGWARYRTPVQDLWMSDRPRIPAAASWARPAGSPRSSTSKSTSAAGSRWPRVARSDR